MNGPVDYQMAASDLIRALRGKRSQPAFSRRLGYKSNVVYTWESGRGFPTAAGALSAARRAGISLEKAFAAFYRTAPNWLSQFDPATPEGVAAFLDDIRGSTSIVDLAAFSGKSRFAISRWMQGKTEPKLPDFLQLVECCSLRLVDFLEQLVDPRELPSIHARWQMLEAARRVAYDKPWTQAILRALELESYRKAPHVRGWLAERVGVSLEVEDESLQLLERAGQIRWSEPHWVPTQVLALDTRKDPQAALRLRRWWGKVALDRVSSGSRGMVYNLFGVSHADLGRLRELQAAYFNELRTIVAQSEPVEHVCLAAVYLMDLADTPAQVEGQA
jgi:transcriptional regulator with XRE-family HTH domain